MNRRQLQYFLVLSWGILPFAFAAYVSAKPISVQVDTAFDQCAWAAEVQVLSVGEQIRVQVTEDPRRVFRGHKLLGKDVDVQPFRSGPTSCRQDLAQLAGTRAWVLMVVTREGCVHLVGQPRTIDEQPVYHLRSWCDWNAVWFYSKDEGFGKPVGERFEGKYQVDAEQIAARFSNERRALMRGLAEILMRPSANLPEDMIDRIIARLGDEDFFIREQAQRELASLNEQAAPFLQQRAGVSSDPEIAARLRAVVRHLQSPLHRHALLMRAEGPLREAGILLEVLASTGEIPKALRVDIIGRLRVMADAAGLELGFDDGLDDEEMIARWRALVEAK